MRHAAFTLRSMYEVRIYIGRDSRRVGFKGKLLPYPAALRVAARLRRFGADAYVAPLRVFVKRVPAGVRP